MTGVQTCALPILLSSVVLGLLSGFIAHFLEMKTNFFKGQFRAAGVKGVCCGDGEAAASEVKCCCKAKVVKKPEPFIKKYKLDRFVREFYNIGIKKILLLFILFIAVGKVAELVIPKEWVAALFSSDKSYSIPLGATIGLPLYISGPSAQIGRAHV